MPSPLFIGADHAGFSLKERLVAELKKKKIPVKDLTPNFKEGDDYPAIGRALARRVTKTKGSRGILVCGSGVGMTIAANRVKQARAVLASTPAQIERARIDDDVNILAMSGWHMPITSAMNVIQVFLKTDASKAARHKRRVKQLG
ncbi:MAG: RpiB/LacA/LacB family sugar-phosphate isomerase [Candidatus Uhrbacteria bacterium]|nr:RpiB/LacA/LacB family sugar-phosphate isomerase [Candidatus Uhrbacteria bacterium]